MSEQTSPNVERWKFRAALLMLFPVGVFIVVVDRWVHNGEMRMWADFRDMLANWRTSWRDA